MIKVNIKLAKLLASFAILYSTASFSHAGHGTHQPWHACENKSLNEQCQYEQAKKQYKGSCQAVNEKLICVRNQPIIDLKPSIEAKKIEKAHLSEQSKV